MCYNINFRIFNLCDTIVLITLVIINNYTVAVSGLLQNIYFDHDAFINLSLIKVGIYKYTYYIILQPRYTIV